MRTNIFVTGTVEMNGGNSQNGAGGNGKTLTLHTWSLLEDVDGLIVFDAAIDDDDATTTDSEINASGGNGATTGGNAGGLYVDGSLANIILAYDVNAIGGTGGSGILGPRLYRTLVR